MKTRNKIWPIAFYTSSQCFSCTINTDQRFRAEGQSEDTLIQLPHIADFIDLDS